MRAILVGSPSERDRLRWRLQGSGVSVVGEFASLSLAHDSGSDADAFIVAPTVSASRAAVDGERAEMEPLTPREREVLDLLSEGLPNKAIAALLGISDQTVKFHVAQITGKLGAANRTEAVRLAIRRGVITI